MKNTELEINQDDKPKKENKKIPNNVKKGKVKAKYDDEYTKATRKFPIFKTVILIIVVAIQITILIIGFSYAPTPQDLIRQYDVTVEPLEDGTLDIEYHFVWEPLDTEQALTWVEIGMANENFTVYGDSVSSNIINLQKYVDEYYVSLELYFDRAYTSGEIIDFSFKINQEKMLCKNEKGYFYEFVPGWFNSIQVEQYEFLWYTNSSKNYFEYGSLDYGEYVKMNIQYGMDDFAGCETVEYYEFDDDGAYNELRERKTFAIVFSFIGVGLLLIAEVYIVDSYVSYGRGRGFLSGHGYYVHTYGRVNPHYTRARDRYKASQSSRGRFGGGGCACACACACAGGGRAGCSQKDTYSNIKKQNENNV